MVLCIIALFVNYILPGTHEFMSFRDGTGLRPIRYDLFYHKKSLRESPKASFCIYSNDKDYQGTIDLWKCRGVHLIATILNVRGLDMESAEGEYQIIRSHNRKNLKAIKIDFDKKFGKKLSQRYNKVLHPLVWVIKGK